VGLPERNNSAANPTTLKYFYNGGVVPTGCVVGGTAVVTTATFPTNSAVFPYTSQTPASVLNATGVITAFDTASFSIATTSTVPISTNSAFSVAFTGTAVPVSKITTTSTSVTYVSNGTPPAKGNYVSVSVPTDTKFSITNALVIATTATSFTVLNPRELIGPSVSGYTYTYFDASLVNNTIYSVTFMAYKGTSGGTFLSSTQFIQWEPENQTSYTVVPTSVFPTQQADNDYYYCYTYAHWVRLINKALNTAWRDVTASTGLSNGTTINCPFVEFDETTGLYSINQDAQTSICPVDSYLPYPYNVRVAATTAPLLAGAYSLVGMNSNLEGMISNWENIYYGSGKIFKEATNANSYTNGTTTTGTSSLATGTACPLPEVVISNGMSGFDTVGSASVMTFQPIGVGVKTRPVVSSYQLTNPFTAATISTTGASPIMVRMTETNISTGSLWSPCASFVIGTQSIPVRMEETSNPVVIGEGNNGGESGSGGSFQKVLIETPINAVTADLWRGFVYYQPLVPTYSSMDPVHDGISQLDFQVYWRNRLTNSLIPLKLYNSGTFSIRLLFRRKGIA
jgi:hypothetical protein